MDETNAKEKSLTHVEVRGYKSIEACNLEMRRLNVLIGANGAGKSNFISVFRLLNNLIAKNFQNFIAKEGGADDVLHSGRAYTDEVILRMAFKPMTYACVLHPTNDGKLFFAQEETTFNRGIGTDYRQELGSGHLETKLVDSETPSSVYVTDVLRSWKVYHFHDTSSSAKVKQLNAVDDNDFLRSDGGNLAAFLYFLKEKHKLSYRQIVKTIQLVAPFFKDFVLKPSRRNSDRIRLEWQQRASDKYMNASQLSDGTLRMMCLATLLLQPDPPATIIIDEPELGLHPYALRVLAGLLKTTSAKRQVIVSTQSVLLVDNFVPEDIIVVDYLNDSSSFRRLDPLALAGWLENYSLGELWQKNVFGGRPA